MTPRLPPFLRSPVFWLLLGVFAAEFWLFDQIGARRHTTVYPRFNDQIQYLTESYAGYEFARSRGLVGGVLDALTNPSAQGTLHDVFAILTFYVAGPSRSAALAVNMFALIACQADAIHRGFSHLTASLGPNDVMAWVNSDDLLAPGSLRFVAEYFTTHPEIDVLYGHRIIIDDDDRDIGRWIMPRHNPRTLEWIDYVPQETLFWRKRARDIAGGIDPSFQFALDWDLLARFQQAGCRMVRVPYFLGAFRVHAEQKTSQAIHTTGADEMRRIRTRFHGERQDDFDTINRHARHARFWGALTARLHEVGLRW